MSKLRSILRLTTQLTAYSALILAIGGSAYAAPIMINNGLAPPMPENVIDHADDYSNDNVYVRNVGCPPGWPAVLPSAPCPSPGAATEVELVSGGSVYNLSGHDSSTVAMSGGFVGWHLQAYDSSTVAMSGGTVYHTLYANDSSTVAMSGGAMWGLSARDSSAITVSGGSIDNELSAYDFSSITLSGGSIGYDLTAKSFAAVAMSGGIVGGDLLAYDSSTIILIGSNFMADGVPVPYGNLTALTGTLTGTLELGDSLNNAFYQGGYAGIYTGTIRLVPEPSTAFLLAFGLAGLAAKRKTDHIM